jgi:hypothetical protein
MTNCVFTHGFYGLVVALTEEELATQERLSVEELVVKEAIHVMDDDAYSDIQRASRVGSPEPVDGRQEESRKAELAANLSVIEGAQRNWEEACKRRLLDVYPLLTMADMSCLSLVYIPDNEGVLAGSATDLPVCLLGVGQIGLVGVVLSKKLPLGTLRRLRTSGAAWHMWVEAEY